MSKFDAALKGHFARLHEEVTEDNVDEQDEYGRTLLHRACEGGHDNVVAWLIGLGGNVNAASVDGRTALHVAIQFSSRDCVRLLLEAGADPSITDNGGRIPLHFAYMSAECAALLIKAHPPGLGFVDKEGATPLHIAVDGDGPATVVRLLLNAGTVVDTFCKAGFTPLYSALYARRVQVAGMLLDCGAQLERVKLDDDVRIPAWAKKIVARRQVCRLSCWAVLQLARQRSSVIGGNNRDVLRLITQIIWNNRCDASWVVTTERIRKQNKMKKQ